MFKVDKIVVVVVVVVVIIIIIIIIIYIIIMCFHQQYAITPFACLFLVSLNSFNC